jgi:hypothetical protein
MKMIMGGMIALRLGLALLVIHESAAFTGYYACRPSGNARKPLFSPPKHQSAVCFMRDDANGVAAADTSVDAGSRRTVLKTMASIPLIWVAQAMYNPAGAKGIKPDAAFESLVKAREELFTAANTYIPNGDYDGLRAYLADEAMNINNYEKNAQILLESKRLDMESKKEIGTIRRYGVGADVIIMYGGLKAEIQEESPNYSKVKKYLKMTVDSLDEVIAICRSNGF